VHASVQISSKLPAPLDFTVFLAVKQSGRNVTFQRNLLLLSSTGRTWLTSSAMDDNRKTDENVDGTFSLKMEAKSFIRNVDTNFFYQTK
jgi:hypothetical protein